MKQRQNPQIVSSPSHPIPIHTSIVIQQQSDDDNYLINPSLVVSSSNQMVLATSFKSSSYNNDKFTLKDDDTMIQKKMETYYNQYGRILGSDRKGFLDHLKFKSLFLSSIRITMIQIIQTLSTYMSNELNYQSELEEKLHDHTINLLEYESELSLYQENEWNYCWNTLFTFQQRQDDNNHNNHTTTNNNDNPNKDKNKLFHHYNNYYGNNKIINAIGKFHLLTFIMRSYESILWNCGLFSLSFLDKVTKDTFASCIRKYQRLKDYKNSTNTTSTATTTIITSSTTTTTTTTRKEMEVTSTFDIGKQMFTTCLYANAISFLSDLTVQQCILFYGYYTFYRMKQREKKMTLLKKKFSEYDNDNYIEEIKEGAEDGEDIDDIHGRSTLAKTIHNDASIAPWVEDEKAIFMLSFLTRSVQATMSKTFNLLGASFGGAIGSMIYPGWGTLFGTQLGDAAVGALLDDDE